MFTPRGGSLGSHPGDVGQVYRYDTRLLDTSHQTSVKCPVTLGDLEGMAGQWAELGSPRQR